MNVTAAAADDDYANHVSNLANGAAHFIQKAFDFLFLLPAICTSILKVDPPPQEMIFFEIEFYRPPDKSPLALPCSLSTQAHREWALLRERVGWAGLPPPLGPTPFSLLPSWADPFRRTSQVFPRLYRLLRRRRLRRQESYLPLVGLLKGNVLHRWAPQRRLY